MEKTTRSVLGSIPGIELVETAQPGTCCGFGGVMRIKHHRLSNAIGDARAQDLMGTAAPIVVTGCPACRMQLAESLKRAGSDAVVLHTVQLIAMRISDCGLRNEERKMTMSRK